MFAQTVIFNIRDTHMREQFLALTGEMLEWLEQCPGFVSYALYEGQNGWSDIVQWESQAHAEEGMKNFYRAEIAQQIIELVEPGFTSFFGAAVAVRC